MDPGAASTFPMRIMISRSSRLAHCDAACIPACRDALARSHVLRDLSGKLHEKLAPAHGDHLDMRAGTLEGDHVDLACDGISGGSGPRRSEPDPFRAHHEDGLSSLHREIALEHDPVRSLCAR